MFGQQNFPSRNDANRDKSEKLYRYQEYYIGK